MTVSALREMDITAIATESPNNTPMDIGADEPQAVREPTSQVTPATQQTSQNPPVSPPASVDQPTSQETTSSTAGTQQDAATQTPVPKKSTRMLGDKKDLLKLVGIPVIVILVTELLQSEKMTRYLARFVPNGMLLRVVRGAILGVVVVLSLLLFR